MIKTVLVTGANRGIGLELVKQYAKIGWAVIACCREPNKATALQQLSQANNAITIHQLDIANKDNIGQLAADLKDATIDMLFNNAGVAGNDCPFGEITEEDLLSTLMVNTIGPTLLIQALHTQIARSTCKIIVNVSSMLSSIEMNRDNSIFWLSYRISKSGLNAATRSLANELKSQNIIVIALDPGWVKTDMGGQDALITTEESVKGAMKVLENISLSESGKLIRYNGEYTPW